MLPLPIMTYFYTICLITFNGILYVLICLFLCVKFLLANNIKFITFYCRCWQSWCTTFPRSQSQGLDGTVPPGSRFRSLTQATQCSRLLREGWSTSSVGFVKPWSSYGLIIWSIFKDRYVYPGFCWSQNLPYSETKRQSPRSRLWLQRWLSQPKGG